MRLRIEASSALAASDISSSERMLSEMRRSSAFTGTSPRKYSAIELSIFSHCENQSHSAAVSRSTAAVSSSSRNESILPVSARLSEPEMSFIFLNAGVPNFADSVNASSVFFSSSVITEKSVTGFNFSALSRQPSLTVCSARSSSILSSSSFL